MGGRTVEAMNWFYWSGVVAWSIIGLRILHFVAETIIVMTLGWDDREELGLCRSYMKLLLRKVK